MTAAPVIEAVRRAGGRFVLRGERLRLSAPEPLPDALVAEVREHKAEILDLLRSGAPVSREMQSPAASDARVESGIEDWVRGVERLSSTPTPPNYPEQAWQQLIADAQRFLEWWGEQAARLGWPTWELFGCHQFAPWGRVQGMGLVLLLRGRELAALTETEAVIRTATGGHQAYRRKPTDPLHPAERRLVWELG